MIAVRHDRYGILAVREVDKPVPGAGEVLVRVHATSLNAADWYGFIGRPYVGRPVFGLRKPKSPVFGGDFAGVVEAVGADSGLSVGGEVYGYQSGALAEYVVVGDAALKPANLSFDEAAAVPLAALTALQGLRDHVGLRPGQHVLVNGGSGGVGTFAVQIAAALGADVHAVCSTGNLEQARELGASRVFDYTREDFTDSGEQYDVIFDNAGSRSWRAMRRVLAPRGMILLVGGPRHDRLLGPLGHVFRVKVAALPSRRRVAFFIAKPNREDLVAVRELVEAGKIRPVIEQRYSLAQIEEAVWAMADGHARGKRVISLAPAANSDKAGALPDRLSML